MTTEPIEQAVQRTTAATHITVFWASTAEVRSSPPLGSLYIDPAGMGGGCSMTLMFASKTPIAEQVTVADRLLAGVQHWRDGLVEIAESRRNAEVELVAAREEIARLKAELDGGDDA